MLHLKIQENKFMSCSLLTAKSSRKLHHVCHHIYFSGLDYWTHGSCLWRRKEQQCADQRHPSHKTCSSAEVAHLNVASSSVPNHPALLDGNLGVAISRPHQQVHMHTMKYIYISFVPVPCHKCNFSYFSSLHSATLSCFT